MDLSPSHQSTAVRTVSSQADWTSCDSPVRVTWPRASWRARALGLAAVLLLFAGIGLRWESAQRHDGIADGRAQLRLLPTGEFIRPMVLGYHHVAADLLWLNIVQVLGEREVRHADYEWLFHALDVVTTIDPHYTYAHDVGGVVLAELAGRVDWSNALLEKGRAANPEAWRLPFQLGFNAFFHQQDYVRAAGYMAIAARLPGRPAYVPELAARLYVEGHRPALALDFLDVMVRQTDDVHVLAQLERRKAEVIVERDLAVLEEAVQAYTARVGRGPETFDALIQAGDLTVLPVEPFGGSYRLDPKRGTVVSTTHPQRLRLYHAPDGSITSLR
jgi:hypothetical protein